MIVGVPKETYPGEARVALVPAGVAALAKKAGAQVQVEAGAGLAAGFADADYEAQGATIAADRSALFRAAEVIVQVRSLGANPEAGKADLPLLESRHTVLGMCDPLSAQEACEQLAERQITLFALELIPRITRAQSMDVLSSMASIAGYKAVLQASETLPKMFPMMMTAAGTIKPVQAFVIGAGVAGLQAIATAKRLGAVVRAYDLRPAVKEQVESLGARFVELELDAGDSEDKGGYAKAMGEEFYQKQREMMGRVVSNCDVVITTAAIPGRKSPVLVTEEMVKGMPEGAVIVDLAAERGGNCELTRADEVVKAHGVTILGPTNLPSTVAFHASQMFSNNVVALLAHLISEGTLELDMEDEITQGTLVCRDGAVVHPRLRKEEEKPAAPAESAEGSNS